MSAEDSYLLQLTIKQKAPTPVCCTGIGSSFFLVHFGAAAGLFRFAAAASWHCLACHMPATPLATTLAMSLGLLAGAWLLLCFSSERASLHLSGLPADCSFAKAFFSSLSVRLPFKTTHVLDSGSATCCAATSWKCWLPFCLGFAAVLEWLRSPRRPRVHPYHLGKLLG